MALVSCLAAASSTLSASTSAWASAAGPSVLPARAHAGGASLGEWSGRWWQWAASQPLASSPLLDTTGERCAFGQSGHVWFLAGNFGGSVSRTCAVPSGTMLLFPIITTVCADPVAVRATFDDELLCATDSTTGATGSAQIDGQQVAGLERYMVSSPQAFDLTIPDDNLFGAPGGLYAPSASSGIFLMLTPLAPGEHLIHFSGANRFGFSLDVTYHLTVTPGR